MRRSRRIARIGKFEIRIVIYYIDEKNTEYPCICRSPSKPKKCARHKLGHDFFLRIAIHCGCEGSVDPIKEIQQTDPDDAPNDMKPPENRVEILNNLIHD